MKLSTLTNENSEPLLFKMSTKNNIYASPFSNLILIFIEKTFETSDNRVRLKFRVYNSEHESGGFLLDVILSGDVDDVLDHLDDIATKPKRKYGKLKTIQRKMNNNVSEKWRWGAVKKRYKL